MRTTWLFEGVGLPAGEALRLELGPSGADLTERLPGRFGLPGLVDSHCHLTVGGDIGSLRPESLDYARDQLGKLAQAGVSAIRDVGGDRSITLPLARTIEPGLPVVLAAGRFMAPEGRYFPNLYEPTPPDQLLETVAAEIEDGATWVKLVGDFPSVGPDGPIPGTPFERTYEPGLVAAVVELAHARGARVAAHTTADAASDLVRAGVDSVEHGLALTEDDLITLGARGGAWTPTLCAVSRLPPGASELQVKRARERSEYLASVLPLAARHGVQVLTGSDVVGSIPDEVRLLVEHGLPVDEALAAATTAASAYLGLSGDGNLVTYERDPREDPTVLAEPAAVVVRGVRVR